MKITQGQFSFLPDLTDAEISKQIEYALDNGWALAVEHTDDPHPRNTYWTMWGMPMFDLRDPAGVMLEVNACFTHSSSNVAGFAEACCCCCLLPCWPQGGLITGGGGGAPESWAAITCWV